MLDKNLINILIYTFNKLEKLKKYEEFTNKMWDNFVKEFKEKARNIEETDEDKAWFFEHLFNITYHTADFIENQKNNRNIIYNYNYNLLHNNFDLDKTAHYEFQFNHVDKSTTYSNLIYKLTEKLGIKKLKILIGKYLIKP
jgi:hypothetical protein